MDCQGAQGKARGRVRRPGDPSFVLLDVLVCVFFVVSGVWMFLEAFEGFGLLYCLIIFWRFLELFVFGVRFWCCLAALEVLGVF